MVELLPEGLSACNRGLPESRLVLEMTLQIHPNLVVATDTRVNC